VRGLGLDHSRAGVLAGCRFERLADEAVRLTAQHLAELKAPRRHTVLAAAGIRLEELLTDATLLMLGKLMASLGRAAASSAEGWDVHHHARIYFVRVRQPRAVRFQ
jgi:hypothetical protein